jgi:hypothetical protein
MNAGLQLPANNLLQFVTDCFCRKGRSFAIVARRILLPQAGKRGPMSMRRARMIVLCCALMATSAFGLNSAYSQTQGARVRQQTIQDELQPDGSEMITQHSEMQILTPALASALAQFPIVYNEGSTDLTIVEAYTLKADGRKIPIEPDAIITQQTPGNSPLTAIFTDAKQKVLIFPNVEAGDTIAFTEKRHVKQLYFPGQFLKQGVLVPNIPIDSETIAIIAPKTLELSTETHDVEIQKTQNGDNNVYTLRYSNPNPQADQSSLIANLDHFPRYYISTFKNYDELGRAYGALISPKMLVTPRIKAQADSITAGIASKKEKARAIYEWVSKHVRYVGVEFGNGALVPHDAEAVLANAYGDCKDHVALFSALLKAAGIDSVPVLINASNGYTASKVPTLGQFNHLIAWLPDFKLYADTTANYLPFGTLALSEYGKPVLLAGTGMVGLRQIPLMSADADKISFTSVMTLDEQRRATAESTITGTGVFAAQLRHLGVAIQGIGPERAASDILSKQGKPRATGTFEVGDPDGFAQQYSITSKYSTPQPLLFSVMPAGLRLLPATGDLFIGPMGNTKIKDTDPTPCYNGYASEDLTLNLPANAHVTSLPTDTNLKEAEFHYSSHWTQSGQTVTVHREMNSNLKEPLCDGDVRKEAVVALSAIKKDYGAPLPISYGAGEHPVIGLMSAQLSEVSNHTRRSQDRDWPISIKVTSAPAHGKVTVQTAQGLIRSVGGQLESHSVTRVYYQSEPGYAGKDSFTYERTSEDPSDPLNGRSYTIDVEVK